MTHCPGNVVLIPGWWVFFLNSPQQAFGAACSASCSQSLRTYAGFGPDFCSECIWAIFATSDDPRVAIRLSVLPKRCPGSWCDRFWQTSISTEAEAFGKHCSQRHPFQKDCKEGTTQGDSSKTAVLLNIAQSLIAPE